MLTISDYFTKFELAAALTSKEASWVVAAVERWARAGVQMYTMVCVLCMKGLPSTVSLTADFPPIYNPSSSRDSLQS